MKLEDAEPLEDRPRINLQRRKRGPKKKAKSKREIELSLLTPRMRDLAEGRLKVEDLDYEELLRGRLRDKNGGWSGGAPSVLPRAWHDAVRQEIVRNAENGFRENFAMTMDVLMQMIKNPRTPAREKLQALQYVQERVIGKIVEKKEISAEVSVFDRAVQNGEFLVDLEDLGEVDNA